MEFIFLLPRKGDENQIYISKLSTMLLLLLRCTQSCLTLCNLMDSSLPASSVHGTLQASILDCVVIPFSKGSFPTRGSNPGLLHCRQILYHLSHQRSPSIFYLTLTGQTRYCFFKYFLLGLSFSLFFGRTYSSILILLLLFFKSLSFHFLFSF